MVISHSCSLNTQTTCTNTRTSCACVHASCLVVRMPADNIVVLAGEKMLFAWSSNANFADVHTCSSRAWHNCFFLSANHESMIKMKLLLMVISESCSLNIQTTCTNTRTSCPCVHASFLDVQMPAGKNVYLASEKIIFAWSLNTNFADMHT